MVFIPNALRAAAALMLAQALAHGQANPFGQGPLSPSGDPRTPQGPPARVAPVFPELPAPLAATARTATVGEPAGAAFEDVRSNGSMVGLRIAYGNSGGRRIIAGVQPIYLTASGRELGEKCGAAEHIDATIEAREGYAVGALDARVVGDRIAGLDLVFKQTADQPAPAGISYKSEWFGAGTPAGAVLVGGGGRPIVGVFGKADVEMHCIGLIFRVEPGRQRFPAGAFRGAPAATEPPAALAAEPAAAPLPGSEPALAIGANLVQDYRNGLVFVEGPQGRGSGFICNLKGHKLLLTNAHVLAGIHPPEFKLLDRSSIKVSGGAVAVDHDIAAVAVTEGGKEFDAMESVDTNAAIGDEVLVLGNSEGAGVIKPLQGKIVGLGPNLVEVSAEFVPGNSGSPIIHKATGKVIGIATYLMEHHFHEDGGKQVKTEIRRFGYRLDSVKSWQPIVWPTFYAQAAEVEKIQTLTTDLIAFLDDVSSGRVHAERHQNPAIKSRIQEWLEIRRRRGVSSRDLDAADENLLSFLRLSCKSDIAQAKQRLTYDYFQRKIERENGDRQQLEAIFGKLASFAR